MMLPKYTVKELQDFEQEIFDLYNDKKVKGVIHLRGGCEQQLIDTFHYHNIREQDWVLCYWASHIHCLLKGVPPQELRERIIQGDSIALTFPAYNILCSGIVNSLAGVACGIAAGLKRKGSDAKVYLFSGDMAAEAGAFLEAVKYATNFNLPIQFIIEDNGVSVMTDTRKTWGIKDFLSYPQSWKISRYVYENTYPHNGIAKKVSF